MVLVGVVRWRVAATAHRGRGLVATEKRDSHRSPPMVHRFACGCAWVPAESGCGWGTACPMMECCWSLGGEAPAAAFVYAAGESRHSPSSLLWSRTPSVCSRQRSEKSIRNKHPHSGARAPSQSRGCHTIHADCGTHPSLPRDVVPAIPAATAPPCCQR